MQGKGVAHNPCKGETAKVASAPPSTLNAPDLVVSSSLLKNLLLELGLTETAKALESEARLLVERAPLSYDDGGYVADDSTKLPKEVTSNSEGNSYGEELEHVRNGNLSSDGVTPMGRNGKREEANSGACDERQLRDFPVNISNTFLFRALLSSVDENEKHTDGGCVFQRLCELALAPLEALHDVSCASRSEGGAVLLFPLLHELLKTFVGDLSGEVLGVSFAEGAARSPEASIIDVFVAYVEVMWAQLCLTEAVTLAELNPGGWGSSGRDIIHELSHLQEKVQYLLLEVHQLVPFGASDANTSSAPHHDSLGDVSTLTAKPSEDPRPPGVSNSLEGKVDFINAIIGICSLFSECESIFRENMEEVSVWILKQLLHYSSPSGLGGTCAPCSKHTGNVPPEENIPADGEADHPGETAARQMWSRVVSAVRRAALSEVDNSKRNVYGKASVTPAEERLLCAQVAIRIQFFAWLIGSTVDMSVVVNKGHSDPRGEQAGESSHEENGTSQRGTVDSTVRVAVGIWYHHCATQLQKKNNSPRSGALCSASTESRATLRTSPGVQTLCKLTREACTGTCYTQGEGCLHCVQTEFEGNDATVLLRALKSAAYESLTVPRLAFDAPRHVLLCNKLLHDEAVYTPPIHVPDGLSRKLPTDAEGVRARESVYEALITSKPSEGRQSLRKPCATVHLFLRKVFCKTRILLSLQEANLPFDVQLRCMESAVTQALPLNETSIISAMIAQDTTEVDVRSFSLWAEHSRHAAIEEVMTSGGAPPIEVIQIADNIEGDSEGSQAWERSGGPLVSPASAQLQFLRRLLMGSRSQMPHLVLPPPSMEEGDDVVMGDNVNRTDEVVLNEVQVISLTPCGSLLALLTTEGRLVVYAMRSGASENGDLRGEFREEKYSERIVINAHLLTDSSGLRWYDQLALLLAFSPCGRFLLCSVQHVSPPGETETQVQRPENEETGKIRIYSLHCEQDDNKMNPTSTVLNPSVTRNGCNDERLYAIFKEHNAPVTVACWLDCRFWQGERTTQPPRLGSEGPAWRRAASFHLSFLQCLSCGCDNTIVRWNAVDGSCLQSIATPPVRDILFSPLMQAFYTITHCGQLSMYDAWNERDITNPEGCVIEVGQRGLPASLSVKRSSRDTDGESGGGAVSDIATQSSDSDVPEYFYAGTQTIRFDRQCEAQEDDERESLIARMSRVVGGVRVPSGTETRKSSRIGRRILRDALRHEVPRATLRGDFVLCPPGDFNAGDDAEETNRHFCYDKRQRRPHAEYYASPISTLRSRHFPQEDDRRRSDKPRDTTTEQDRHSTDGDVILYKSGSRLVFVEVPHAICHAAHVRRSPNDGRYSAPPGPYHLLSMTASGSPVWDENEPVNVKVTQCRCRRSLGNVVVRRPLCSYYTDYSLLRRGTSQNPSVTAGRHDINANSNAQSVDDVTNGDPFRWEVCRHCQGGKPPIFKPTAKNGRYLCVTASVGPNRFISSHGKPLEHNPGMYVCLVFDVVCGSVVRVIPVCSTQPHFLLTQNGVTTVTSKAKKAPTYVLPCSVTVLPKRPRRRGDCSGRQFPTGIATPSAPLYKCEETAASRCPSYGHKEHDKREVGNGDSERDDSVVIVAIGALHGKVHVFNAVTGTRLKVVNLREEGCRDVTAQTGGRRTPTKRARCSYSSFMDADPVPNPSREFQRAESDGSGRETDFGSSSTLSEISLQQEDWPGASRRQSTFLNLTEAHGVSAVLQSTLDILTVVPFPFSFYEWQQGHGGKTLNPRGSRSNHHSNLPFAHTTDEVVRLFDGVSCLKPYPSFLAQMMSGHMRSASNAGNSTSSIHCGAKGVKGGTTTVCNSSPFEFVSLQALRRTLRSATETQTTPQETDDGATPLPHLPPSSTRFRCGVVNSVALMWDDVRSGIYLFSSDEYGGFFITGDRI